jgi:hypothetical protein
MGIEQSPVLTPTRSCTEVLISTQISEKRVTTVTSTVTFNMRLLFLFNPKKLQWSLKSNQDISAT